MLKTKEKTPLAQAGQSWSDQELFPDTTNFNTIAELMQSGLSYWAICERLKKAGITSGEVSLAVLALKSSGETRARFLERYARWYGGAS